MLYILELLLQRLKVLLKESHLLRFLVIHQELQLKNIEKQHNIQQN